LREEQDIKSFITGSCAVSAIEGNIVDGNIIDKADNSSIIFSPFISESVDSHNIDSKQTLSERAARIKNTDCKRLLDESLKSKDALTNESSYRNIINMIETNEVTIADGNYAKNEIYFMEAVSSDHNLDIEGKNISDISGLISEDRSTKLQNLHIKIDLYEMLGVLSHTFFSEHLYREKYKEVLEGKSSTNELISLASKLTSDNFNLLSFFSTSRNSCKESLFDYIGDGLKEIALEYRNNLLSNDKEKIKSSLMSYNSQHRKLLNETYILSDDIIEYRNNLTVNANIFFYCREYTNVSLSDDISDEEKQAKLDEISSQINEESLITTKGSLDIMRKNLTSLQTAIENASIIQNILNFATASIGNNISEMNNILSELPSIVSNDLIKISDTRLSYLANIEDARSASIGVKTNEKKTKPDEFIEKIINAIPKGDPRRELIRQQLLKQFGLEEKKKSKKKKSKKPDEEQNKIIARPDPTIPNPQEDFVSGFELQNNAFNVRNGGMRLEGNSIIFSPNKNITEVLIPAATISILTQTDPDKPLLIEGNHIKGLSVINTRRSNIMHVEVKDNMLIFITTKGRKVLVFKGIETFRIHSSTQADGWFLNKQDHKDIEREIKIVFNHINEQRLKTLRPTYSSDILSFQDK